jgi:hypothetical protein
MMKTRQRGGDNDNQTMMRRQAGHYRTQARHCGNSGGLRRKFHIRVSWNKTTVMIIREN